MALKGMVVNSKLRGRRVEYVRNVLDAQSSKGFAVKHHFCPAFLNS
jgi:hypothetical protein